MNIENEMTDSEIAAIEELKSRLKEDPNMTSEIYEDSYFFLRFLRAREFNIVQSESMLKKHLQWRKENDIDNFVSKFKEPEVLKKYLPHMLIAFDNDGCPIKYIPSGNFDVYGLIQSAEEDEMINRCIYDNECDTKVLKEQSKKLGRNIDKVNYIYNVENLTLAKISHIELVRYLMNVLTLFQDNYPERLKKAYIINSSYIFTSLFNITKGILVKSILAKVVLYSNDSYKEDLRKIMNPDDLPVFLGGNKTDPDGNPLCLSFINHATSPIPKSYYKHKMKKVLKKDPEVQKITIEKSSFEDREFRVEQPECYLEWEFETQSNDVGFGLFFKEVSGGVETLTEIISIRKIRTDDYSSIGTHKCKKQGIYVMRFDNTYSWFRPKKVYLKAKVTRPKGI